jgi:hypothetical protein
MRCACCGNEQLHGTECNVCGIPFPTGAPAGPAPRQKRPADEPEAQKCFQCGVATTLPICPGCGMPVRKREFL